MNIATNVSQSGAAYPCAKEGCETAIAAGQIYCSRHRPKSDAHPFKAPATLAAAELRRKSGRGQDVKLPGSPLLPKVDAPRARCEASPTGAHHRICTPDGEVYGIEWQTCKWCGDVKRIAFREE